MPANEITRIISDIKRRWGDRKDELDPIALTAYAGQVATLREAQRRVAEEGQIISDPKGNPIAHPCIGIERAAAAEIRAWGDRFTPPTDDDW